MEKYIEIKEYKKYKGIYKIDNNTIKMEKTLIYICEIAQQPSNTVAVIYIFEQSKNVYISFPCFTLQDGLLENSVLRNLTNLSHN